MFDPETHRSVYLWHSGEGRGRTDLVTAMKRTASEERFERGLFGLFVAVLAVSVLAVGGVSPRFYLPVAIVALAGGIVDCLRPVTSRHSSFGPAVVLSCLALVCVVQALPLPLSLVEAVSPTTADVWARSLLPLEREVTTGSLSLSPSATWFEAVKWSSYVAVFLLGARASRRFGAPVPLLAVFSVGVLIALVALGHKLVEATKVFGLYEPVMNVVPGNAGPLLNPNNLAGYLNLSVLVGSGLALSKRPPVSRWLLGTGLVITLAVSLLTASRGGVGAVVVGLFAFGVWATLARRAKVASARVISYATTAALFVGAAFALLGAKDTFWAELLSENVEKLQLPLWSVPLVKDHPWIGIGRGAFESVFFAYRPQAPSNLAYTHPENFIVQWVAEWGLVIPALAAAALVWFFARARAAITRSAVLLGATFAVLTLLLQNLVDLGLEVASVSVALSATLGAIWGAAPREPEPRRPLARYGVLGTLALGLVAAVVVVAGGLNTVEEDRKAIQEDLRSLSKQPDRARSLELEQRLAQLMQRYPADHYFPLAGAYNARLRGESPIAWIQRALERGPTVGRTHLLLGEYLLSRGLSSQGLLELRLGLEYEPSLGSFAAPLLVRYARSNDEVLEGAPRTGTETLEQLALAFAQAKRTDTRRALDREILTRDPTRPEPRQRLAVELMDSLEQHTELCAATRTDCFAELEEHLAELERHDPTSSTPALLRARMHVLDGEEDVALDVLRAGCQRPRGRLLCLQTFATVLAKRGASEELGEVLDKAAATACATRAGCADANRWVGGVHLQVGNTQQAVTWFERAARQDPTAARWVELAEIAQNAGLPHVTAQAVAEAGSKRDASDPAIAARLERLKPGGR
jgi:tetratricopeptide (TPR) repeat protein/O-antigen ligase